MLFIYRISRKISAGYDFDFVMGYPKFTRKYDLEKINAQAKTLFCSDPCEISTIMPKKNRTEHHDESRNFIFD